MTLRTRLMILTILGLALTMAVWGWIQLRALDKILIGVHGEDQHRHLGEVLHEQLRHTAGI